MDISCVHFNPDLCMGAAADSSTRGFTHLATGLGVASLLGPVLDGVFNLKYSYVLE